MSVLTRFSHLRDRRAEVEEDVAPFRGMTPDEHDRILQQVVRAAFSVLKTRDDWERIVAAEPPAPGYREAVQRALRHG